MFKYSLLTACWLGWFIVFLNRFSISPILSLIENEFSILHSEAGLLMSSYLLAYAIMQIPAGIFSDRFGRKYMIVLGLLISSLSNIFIGLSSDFTHMVLYRFLTGLGAGTYFSASTSIISDAFPAGKRGKPIGLTSSGIGVGTVTAVFLGGLIAELNSWRLVFLTFTIPGLIGTILFWRLVKENRKHIGNIRNYRIPYMSVFKSKSLTNLTIIHFLVLAAYFSLNTFIPTYLTVEAKLSLLFANIIFMALPLFEIPAGPLGGLLADKIGKKYVSITGLLVIAFISSILPLAKSPMLFFISLILIGFMIRAILTFLSVFVTDTSSPSNIGTALGLYNAMGFLGSSIGPYVFGLLTDLYGFNSAFLFTGIIACTTIPLIILIRE
ncbi:MAG: MFS transporter [Candidatus Methanomethylicia archaeon]